LRIHVRCFGHLRKTLGHQLDIELDAGATIGGLLRELGSRMGKAPRLIDGEGEIAPNLSVLVNGLSANLLDGPAHPLSDGDVVSLLPPSGGG
jgi:MoaD family protein